MAIFKKDKKEPRKVNLSTVVTEENKTLASTEKKETPTTSPSMKSPSLVPAQDSQTTNERGMEAMIERRFGGNVRSVLSSGTVINGKLSFDTPVRIDGKLTGEVFSSKTLIVGPTGQIDADIQVEGLIVLGGVSGHVKATKGIEVYAGGNLNADIEAGTLAIEDGTFNGSCKMRAA